MMRRTAAVLALLIAAPSLLVATPGSIASAQEELKPFQPVPVSEAMPASEWERVDRAVDRGLAWLAGQQRPDGSFPGSVGGQPAISSLAAMAFLSRGHRPGTGPYGKTIDRAIDFVLTCQKPSGLLLLDRTDMPVTNWHRGAHTAMYNHAISGLMLGEVYGASDPRREQRLRGAIESALRYAREVQVRPKTYAVDAQGWRYYRPLGWPQKGDADLSVTGWFVMFYRSARNAEFNVPEEHVQDALRFVRACYRPEEGAFYYGPLKRDHWLSRGMTGAGLLCLAVGGQPDEEIARTAGRWLLDRPVNRYNVPSGNHDRFHYGVYYSSQAMFMLGGEYWRRYYPPMARTLLGGQTPAGHWQAEKPTGGDFGLVYPTSLAILALTPPYQLLPIYQR